MPRSRPPSGLKDRISTAWGTRPRETVPPGLAGFPKAEAVHAPSDAADGTARAVREPVCDRKWSNDFQSYFLHGGWYKADKKKKVLDSDLNETEGASRIFLMAFLPQQGAGAR